MSAVKFLNIFCNICFSFLIAFPRLRAFPSTTAEITGNTVNCSVISAYTSTSIYLKNVFRSRIF